MELTLDGPKALVLPPDYIAVILDCLSEGRFRVVNPVIQEIFKQVEGQSGHRIPDGQSGDTDELPREGNVPADADAGEAGRPSSED